MFNESKMIAIALYSAVFASLVAIGVGFGLDGSMTPPALATLLAFMLWASTCIIYGVLFVPKWVSIYLGTDEAEANMTTVHPHR